MTSRPQTRRRPRSTGVLTLGAVAALAAGLGGMQPAAAASSTTASASPGCALRPSTHTAQDTELRSCFQVDASMSAAPAVGQVATVRFTVTSAVAAQGVQIGAELSPNLQWVSRPAGMAATSRVSKAPHLAGTLAGARQFRAMARGQQVTYVGTVRAVRAGAAQVSVTATGAGAAAGGRDTVFLTVGRTAAASRFGIATSTTGATARTTARATRPIAALRGHKQASLAGATGAAQAASPGGRACATGSWNYTDADGNGRPAISWTVEAFDKDPSGGDDLLASGLTGFDGSYNLCFSNDDRDGGGGQEVYMRFTASNKNWRVQKPSGSVYRYVSSVASTVADGGTDDFGWLQPAAATEMRAAAAFAAVQVVWNNTPGSCWDMIGRCDPVVVQWAPDSKDGTFYRTSDKKVHLLAEDPDAPIVVAHEATHSIMDDVYDGAFPSAPNCDPHFIQSTSSAGCAWTEGFAEWLPATVFNDPSFRWPNGAVLDLEGPTWGSTDWDDGDQVEGRVAGALIDITDGTNEGTDRVGEGMNNIWTTFQKHNSTTFAKFWQDRAADRFDTSNDALGSLYQNTIDYGFDSTR